MLLKPGLTNVVPSRVPGVAPGARLFLGWRTLVEGRLFFGGWTHKLCERLQGKSGWRNHDCVVALCHGMMFGRLVRLSACMFTELPLLSLEVFRVRKSCTVWLALALGSIRCACWRRLSTPRRSVKDIWGLLFRSKFFFQSLRRKEVRAYLRDVLALIMSLRAIGSLGFKSRRKSTQM